MHAMGVTAVKIEGRQRSPRYVETVTRVWREAIDVTVLSLPARQAPAGAFRAALGQGGRDRGRQGPGAREEDADTLFFNRRLVVEGDTEAALLVKNSLDCIKAPRTRAILRRALRLVPPGP